MSGHIVKLEDADELSLVGGKALALGKMLRAGINVPGGFVITAGASLTPALKKSILTHFDALQTEAVAVRSSAINEDSPSAAWAGQLDTFLNCTRENLLENIKTCQESASSARAISYAKLKGIQSSKVAVIVQKMIQSDVSGVAFSAHPVTHNKNHMVIEAALGLGEATVSGEITPDMYIIDKADDSLIQKYIAEQSKMLTQTASGVTSWLSTANKGSKQKLLDEEIAELSKLIKKLETYFGHYVDVEWAISSGIMYILQSRPITTLDT